MGAIQTADDYTNLGWAIHPLHAIHGGHCTCKKCKNCKSPGKHPLTRNGVKQATTNLNQIHQWQNQWPHANIGIATGNTSKILVMDVDAGKGGLESFAKLSRDYGSDIADTLTADTGGGGFHLIYRMPDTQVRNSQGTISAGIDIRGDGGYIVGAPSTHISGKKYGWRDGLYQPEKIPDALLGAILGNQHRQSSANLDLPAAINTGMRNDVLFRHAASLRGRGCDLEAIRAAISQINLERCVAPLCEDEIDRIANSAATYGKGSYGLLNLYRQEITKTPDIAGLTKLVLLMISLHADSESLVAFPSQKTIANEASISLRTAGIHIEIASKLGWLSRTRKSRADNKQGWRYEYQLTFPSSGRVPERIDNRW